MGELGGAGRGLFQEPWVRSITNILARPGKLFCTRGEEEGRAVRVQGREERRKSGNELF